MKIHSYCCMGDSITSNQVTGIGTVVARKLAVKTYFNAACGFATCSDWHEGDVNVTPVSLIEPPNTNTADNVLSNQVRRILQAITPEGESIRWTVDGTEYTLEGYTGTGTLPTPEVIYIAAGANDGNNPRNRPEDDFAAVAQQPYAELTRCGFCASLIWAIRTLQAVCPDAAIYVATPLQTAQPDTTHMGPTTNQRKRRMVMDVCDLCKVRCIDSFTDSGFTAEVAVDHGNVHPDAEWKERIAAFLADFIRKDLKDLED